MKLYWIGVDPHPMTCVCIRRENRDTEIHRESTMWWQRQFSSVQFSSAAQSCPTLCDPMDCSTPGLPVHHHLLEFTQTHVHWVGDAIPPSHPLSSPSPALNLFQHQGNWCPEELMLLNCVVGEDSWESLGLLGDPTSPFWRRSALGFLWKEWC